MIQLALTGIRSYSDLGGADAFCMNIPSGFRKPMLEVFLKPGWNLRGEMKDLRVELLMPRHAAD